jgi:hypothetical protein
MQRELELERKEKLAEKEIESLTNEILELKRIHRAEIDEQKLEIETLKFLLAQTQPDFNERFQAMREKVRMETSPE